MGRLIFIGGGVRSGKSRFALSLARRIRGRRLFVATAEARDAEMAERIARHRQERGEDFATIEAPVELAETLGACRADVVLIDCLTLWLSNLLLAGKTPREIDACVGNLLGVLAKREFQAIVVTNEVGMGIVPESPLGRVFRDVAGSAHQRLSAAADEVFFAVLGTMLRLKPAPAFIPWGQDV